MPSTQRATRRAANQFDIDCVDARRCRMLEQAQRCYGDIVDAKLSEFGERLVETPDLSACMYGWIQVFY